jgi:hypothetical protein
MMAIAPPQVWEVWYRRAVNLAVVTMAPAVDLTGWALAFAVMDAAGADVLTKTTVNGGVTVTNLAAGVFQFTLAPEDEGLELIEGYWYQVRRTDVGLEDILASGPLVMRAK